MTNRKGFTLIELLVVIAIIGLLSSVVLASLNTARSRANDAKRLSDIRQVQRALELFATDNNGRYPDTGSVWRSQCPSWGGHAQQSVIPGLVPTYMSQLPADPQMNTAASTCCYMYISNGVEYGFMDYNCPTVNFATQPTMQSPLYRVWAVWTPAVGGGWL